MDTGDGPERAAAVNGSTAEVAEATAAPAVAAEPGAVETATAASRRAARVARRAAERGVGWLHWLGEHRTLLALATLFGVVTGLWWLGERVGIVGPVDDEPGILAGIRGLNRLEPEELAAVKAAVDALLAGKGPAIERAKAELAKGNTAAAEAIFRAIGEGKAAEGAAANREAAEAFRHLGALAWLHDGAKALDAYRRAAALDPDDAWTWIFIGRLEQRLGRLGPALAAFQEALAVATRSAAAEPGKAARQRDVYASEMSIADVLVQQGRLGDAARAYQKVLETSQRLAAAEPTNSEWQRDLSVSWERIGDVRRARGDLAGALAAYEQGLAIRQKLAAAEPTNSEWQRDLIVSNVKLAEVASGSGKRDEAAERYRRALGIARALRDSGRLAPRDAWMVADLAQRLTEAMAPEPAAGAR